MIRSCFEPQVNLSISLEQLYKEPVTIEDISLFSSDFVTIAYGIVAMLKDAGAFKFMELPDRMFKYEFKRFINDNSSLIIRFLNFVDSYSFQGAFCEIKGQFYYLKLLIESDKVVMLYRPANIDDESFNKIFTFDNSYICDILAKE